MAATSVSGKEFPKVSIVTPCLNAANTIERTIDSVFDQQYQNIQYIVVDGVSTDGTLDILREYESTESRMTVVSRPDRSMTEALNRGFAAAEGDIVGSINADDWYVEGVIDSVVSAYRNRPFDCLVGNTRYVWEGGGTLHVRRPWLAPWRLAWEFMGCLTPECSVFFSRSCIRHVGMFDESLKYTQDFEYYLRVLEAKSVIHLDEILSNFWISEDQISEQAHELMQDEVKSYTNHPVLRRFFGGTRLASMLQVVTGQRIYDSTTLLRHFKKSFIE